MWAWALLPILLTVWATAGIWIVYAMAVANGSVDITISFPYISAEEACNILQSIVCQASSGSEKIHTLMSYCYGSTCGSYPPQSCIFGQVLNVGAFLVVWISAIRFQQIRDYGCHSALNSASLAMGLISALGTSIVANFQQSIQLETHLTGAFLAFFIGNVYFWLQTALTYQVTPKHGGCWIGVIRFCLSLACTALILMMVVFISQKMVSIAAICEWIVAMILFLLFGLFAVDFWHLDGHFFHVQKKRTVIPHEMQVSTVTLDL